jgi:hypothetical protein
MTAGSLANNGLASQHRQLAHELIVSQIVQLLHLDDHILGQNPRNYTDINSGLSAWQAAMAADP